MLADSFQIMWVYSHLIWAEDVRYLQIIWAEKTDACEFYGLCSQAATDSPDTDIHDYQTKIGNLSEMKLG